MSRGFVTIATGKTHYYKIAANLLASYRLHASRACPFAIICDRENEYTAAFDKLVRMENPAHSYLDKLRLFDCLPWDETIFIDADCLVYGNIDRWWELFEENGSDFSVFGWAYEDLKTDKGWFRSEGMGEFQSQIHYVPASAAGYTTCGGRKPASGFSRSPNTPRRIIGTIRLPFFKIPRTNP